MPISAKVFAAFASALLASCATTQGTQWKADLKCNASGDRAAFTTPLAVRVIKGEFFLEHAAPTQPGYVGLRGFPDPDDRLELVGRIAPPEGKPEPARLEGRRDGTGFSAYGRSEGRSCGVSMKLE